MTVSPDINPLTRLYQLASLEQVQLDDDASFLSISAPLKSLRPGEALELVRFLLDLPSDVLSKLILRFGKDRLIDFTGNDPASWFDWDTIHAAKLCDECAETLADIESRLEEMGVGLQDPNIKEDSLQLVNTLEECQACGPGFIIDAGVEKSVAANEFLIGNLKAAGKQVSPLVWFDLTKVAAAFTDFPEFLEFIEQEAEQPIVWFCYEAVEPYYGRYFKLLPLTRRGLAANEIDQQIQAELSGFDSDALSAYQTLVTELKQENRTGLVSRFDVPPALCLRREGKLASYPSHPLFLHGPLRSLLVYSIMAWLSLLRTDDSEEVIFTLLPDKQPLLKVSLTFTLADVYQNKQSIFVGDEWMETLGRLSRDIEHSAGSEFFRKCWSDAIESLTVEDFAADKFFETLEGVRSRAVEQMREPAPDIRQLTPDLSLYIYLDTINKKLLFELGYLNPSLGLKLQRGEKQSPKEDVSINELDEMARRNFTAVLEKVSATSDLKVPKLQKLETRGEKIWDDLVPDDLKREFVKLGKQDLSLFIFSDDRSFPWELIKPREYKDTSKIVPAGFTDEYWGLRFGLGRWTPGAPSPANEMTITNVCCVAASSALSSAQEEIDYFESLKQFGVNVDLPKTLDELLAQLQSKDYDVIHFACHGEYESDDPGESAIQLPDGNLLQPDDLRTGNIPANIGKNRPLIFLNCCHSGRTGTTLVGVAGWAKRLVDWGCGAFIGCGWEVSDPLAAEFAITFYRSFKDENKSLGQAIRQARVHIRDRSEKQGRPQNSTWLAYYLYGNPNCCYKA